MKKKLKAFTLIELIIVIAIFGILMVGIMRLFEPINGVYTSSAALSNQRKAEQGIANYIAENCRYAMSIGVYQDVSSADDAMNKFLALGPTDSKGVTLTKNKLDVICINNKESYELVNGSGVKFKGRLLRKVEGKTGFSETEASLTPDGSGSTYMALSEAFYGPADYYIRINNFSAAGFDIAIESDYYYSPAKKTTGNMFTRNNTLMTERHVEFLNPNLTKAKDDPMVRVVDTSHLDASVGTKTNQTKNTYIVYYVYEE